MLHVLVVGPELPLLDDLDGPPGAGDWPEMAL